jgi:hypothetical protein
MISLLEDGCCLCWWFLVFKCAKHILKTKIESQEVFCFFLAPRIKQNIQFDLPFEWRLNVIIKYQIIIGIGLYQTSNITTISMRKVTSIIMIFILHISQSTTMWWREKLWINSRLYNVNSKTIWLNIIHIFKRIFK